MRHVQCCVLRLVTEKITPQKQSWRGREPVDPVAAEEEDHLENVAGKFAAVSKGNFGDKRRTMTQRQKGQVGI